MVKKKSHGWSRHGKLLPLCCLLCFLPSLFWAHPTPRSMPGWKALRLSQQPQAHPSSMVLLFHGFKSGKLSWSCRSWWLYHHTPFPSSLISNRHHRIVSVFSVNPTVTLWQAFWAHIFQENRLIFDNYSTLISYCISKQSTYVRAFVSFRYAPMDTPNSWQHFLILQKGARALRFDFSNNPLGRRQMEIQICNWASHRGAAVSLFPWIACSCRLWLALSPLVDIRTSATQYGIFSPLVGDTSCFLGAAAHLRTMQVQPACVIW